MIRYSRKHTPQQGSYHFKLHLAHLMFGWLPTFVASRFRMYALRTAGFHIGRGTILGDFPTFIGSGKLQDKLSIGEECGFNVGCFFDLEAPITLGNHVALGHDVMILTTNYNTSDPHQRAGNIQAAPVTIGDGAWIGARCTILPGVTIGPGAVIGATMVINKDIPANTLVMGKQKISLAKWR